MIQRRIFAAVALLCALVAPAHAQKTKAQIVTEIGTNLPDNTVGQITPQGLRAVALDTVNSIMPTAPVVSGNLPSFSGATGLLQDSGVSAFGAAPAQIVGIPSSTNTFLGPWSVADQSGASVSVAGTTTQGLQEFLTACAKPDSVARPAFDCTWHGGQEPPANGGGARIVVANSPLTIGPSSGKKLDLNATSVFPPVVSLGSSALLTIDSQIMADFRFGGDQILNNRGTGPSVSFRPTTTVQTVGRSVLDSEFFFTTVGNILLDTSGGAGGFVVSNLKAIELNADRLAGCAVTITNASPAVVTCPGGSPLAATHVQFSGTLPTGITAGTTYYVSSAGRTATTYQIADTELHAVAGTNSINTSSASSGVTATAFQQSPYGFRGDFSGSNLSFNEIDIAHLHDIGPGTDAFQWGTAAVPGGINASGNFFKLRISTGNTTANGIHTWAPGNFYLASIDGIATGKSIWLEPGACGNIIINPYNSAPSTITDNGGCNGNDNQGNILIRTGRITIGGQLVPTIATAIPSGRIWVSDPTGLTARDGGVLATIATSGSASDLVAGTVPSARMTGAYTGITGLGTLTSLAVTGAINAGTYLIGTSAITPTITYEGDSITAGSGGTHPYNFYITPPTYNGLAFTQTNIGVGGSTVVTMQSAAPTNLNPLYHYASGLNTIILLGGVNDLLGGASVAQTYSNIVAFAQQERALGFKVLIGTLTSACNTGTVDANRASVNALIYANWPQFADGLVDFAGNANIGAIGQCNNTTYFNTDKLHPTDAGYTIMGSIAQTALTNYVANLANVSAVTFSAGTAGSTQGSVQIGNATAGTTTITNAANGGNGVIQTPNTSGTMAVSASAPLALASGTGNLTLGTVGIANGGTNCTSASITCFNNITGLSAAGTTGTTSTNLVFSTSPTITTPTINTINSATATDLILNVPTGQKINFQINGVSSAVYNSTGFLPAADNTGSIGSLTGPFRWQNIVGVNVISAGSVQSASGHGIPVGGDGLGISINNTTFGVFYGSGVPTMSAGQGSLYLRTDGTAANRLYVNNNGTTGWTAY